VTTGVLIRLVVSIVVAVFALGIVLTGGHPDPKLLQFFAWAVFAATAVLWIWERFVWKWGPAQGLPRVPRNLNGTWKGQLESFWKDPSTGQSPPPKDVYLVIRQTATTTVVALLTNESRSDSSVAMVSDEPGLTTLAYIYLNRPDPKYEDRSRMHHGGTTLDVTGRPATRLRGRYWTDRDTRGQLDFTERRSSLADDFAQAQAMFD
jgi:hypothetical protein